MILPVSNITCESTNQITENQNVKDTDVKKPNSIQFGLIIWSLGYFMCGIIETTDAAVW